MIPSLKLLAIAARLRFINVLWLVLTAGSGLAGIADHTVLECPRFRLLIDSNGQNVSFVDRTTGTDYLDTQRRSYFAQVRTSRGELSAASVALDRKFLTLGFADANIKAILKVETHPTHITLEVVSIEGTNVESLTFLNIPLMVEASPQESFGACALGLTLNTRIKALPVLQRHLQASCETKFGMVGAKVAIVAAPMKNMLTALQTSLVTDSELPICKVAGPWANGVAFNHGSYLFNYGELTETNVDEWIGIAKRLGFKQIDNHGGSADFFRFGDMALNPQKWPDGWESQRRIVSQLKQAGIGSILHTYAFFIDKQSKYVTPIPDARLDATRTFTLAAPLSSDATEIKVNESTAGIVTTTGFFEQNSVILHIDNELVTFSGANPKPPWGFTGVKRGALGTLPAVHHRGATGRHLKECFGLLVPDVDSSLFTEIAANHAAVVNQCSFDSIYLDAIDGSAILRGQEECWYWADKFIVEIQKRLNRPVGMEMSAMWHHSWQYRTRGRAWDYPRRGQKRFIDIHAERENNALMLPPHLGWWAFHSFAPPQIEPSYPDVIEHLGARLIGWDAGVSLAMALNESTLLKTPIFHRAADTLKLCETLRQAGAFDETAKEQLRDPQHEFTLSRNDQGQPRFHPTQSHCQTVSHAEPWTLSWHMTNPFTPQPARFRLESLIGVASNNPTAQTIIADLGADSIAEWKIETARGVKLRISPSSDTDAARGTLTATNSGVVPRNAAWGRIEKRFTPPLNLKNFQGIRVEVEGDGSGTLLAIRLESPRHIALGAIADRYIDLDFTGLRQFDLVETESARWSDFEWGDNKHHYHAYRELVDFDAIESISVWLQKLPSGREVKVSIGPIQAVELKSTVLRDPQITISGNNIQFPVALASGEWIEANGPDECIAYGKRGEVLKAIKPIGRWPELRAGANKLELQYEPDPNNSARAKVVLFSRGAAIEGKAHKPNRVK